jgi:hypothetical protein
LEPARKYQFSWDLLGDIELGRPNLGQSTRLEVYRLMQFSFRDILEQRYGADEADRIFYDSGFLAGTQFYDNLIGPQGDINEFVKKLQTVLKELGVAFGIDLSRSENSSAPGDKGTSVGAAVVQEFKQLATELYLKYRIYSLKMGDATPVYDINVGTLGVRVKF